MTHKVGHAYGFASIEMDEVRKFLFNETENFEKITDVVKSDNFPLWGYKALLQFLTGLDIPEEKAKEHCDHIIEHRKHLSEKLQRDIGFRVAALDYFYNKMRLLKNPRFIEIEDFEKILSMSKEDTKLGCYNINYFNTVAHNEIKRAERYSHCFSIIIIDLDDFKAINDTYGHIVGDKILEQFVAVIKANLRSEDVLARYGGDEFIILLPQTGRVGARAMAERIKHRLEEHFKSSENKSISVRFSAGIATYPYDAEDYDTLLDCADKALYKSKFLGKNMIYDYLESERLAGIATGEKRRFVRYRVISDNEIDIQAGNSFIGIDGRIVNISPNGAFIECNCNLADNLLKQPLSIILKRIGNNGFNNLKFKGNIVRVNNESRTLKFYIALQFDKMINASQWRQLEQSAQMVPQ
ncbi:MAG: diguanylate cyclase [Spirochaetes bacterium]|nr:diguanylate cyclase [Spirochaetota bacterium]